MSDRELIVAALEEAAGKHGFEFRGGAWTCCSTCGFSELKDDGHERFVFWHIQQDENAFSEGWWTLAEVEDDEGYLEAISDDLHGTLGVHCSDHDTMDLAMKSLRVRFEDTDLHVDRDAEHAYMEITREQAA